MAASSGRFAVDRCIHDGSAGALGRTDAASFGCAGGEGGCHGGYVGTEAYAERSRHCRPSHVSGKRNSSPKISAKASRRKKRHPDPSNELDFGNTGFKSFIWFSEETGGLWGY